MDQQKKRKKNSTSPVVPPLPIEKGGHERFDCMDCSANTSDMNEYYMVTKEVWILAVPDKKERGNMLCIGCLELRLGRILTFMDFLHCPLNCLPIVHRSNRLTGRMNGDLL